MKPQDEENLRVFGFELTPDEMAAIDGLDRGEKGRAAPAHVRGDPRAGMSNTGDSRMATWTDDELRTVARAEELELASVRLDGTLGNPVTIWVVRVGDDLYVRSWKGDAGAWFRATRIRHAGHIEAGGVRRDVTFLAETDDDINDRIDAAYRTKYRRHGGRYVDPMVAPTARTTTIKLVPRH